MKKPQKPPKDHHFVPQFLLRNFTDEAERLHVYDRRTPHRGIFENPTEKVFFECDLYTFFESDGAKNVELELAFSSIEGQVASVLDDRLTLMRGGKAFSVSPVERRLLALYTYLQWKRVPDIFRRFTDLDSFRIDGLRSLERYENQVRPLTSEEKENFEKLETWRIMFQNVKRDVTARVNPYIVETIDDMNLCLVRITNPRKAFVVSSCPVYKLALPGRTTLGDPSLELWFPVASDASLVWAGKGKGTFVHEMSDGEEIRRLNKAACAWGNMVASRSNLLTSSLAPYAGAEIIDLQNSRRLS